MPRHIRHCVECPNCHVHYLIAFSPYGNGSHLARTGSGSGEEYILYCFCQGARIASCVRAPQVKVCEVSKAAYKRGYGTLEEILPVETSHRAATSPLVWGPVIPGRFH
ncbi:MAG TPA: hypothetical protein VF133_19360 [Terriglobales bacterium]